MIKMQKFDHKFNKHQTRKKIRPNLCGSAGQLLNITGITLTNSYNKHVFPLFKSKQSAAVVKLGNDFLVMYLST